MHRFQWVRKLVCRKKLQPSFHEFVTKISFSFNDDSRQESDVWPTDSKNVS